MAKGSDNPFPSVLLVEGTTPATPETGDQRAYVDTNGVLSTVDDAGAVHPHTPVLLIASGGTVPAGTAPGTIILEKS